MLSGAEDLVPVLGPAEPDRTVGGVTYRIHRYRPRIEGLFARIERWTDTETDESHWRSITRDNVTTLYGKDAQSRIAEPVPAHAARIFSWLISESYDDKGNAMVYTYKREDATDVRVSQTNERNRSRTTNVHLKSIRYGNLVSRLDEPNLAQHDGKWMFEIVFDYGEHDSADPKPDDPGDWLCRNDPVLFLPRWFRGADVPPLPADPRVPSLSRRGRGRRRLSRAVARSRLQELSRRGG